MTEEAKQYVHPNREKAMKALQGIIDFISIKSASGWTPPDFIYGITTLTRMLVRTTNQVLNDVERLQREIDGLKAEIAQQKTAKDGAPVTVHEIKDPEPAERRANAE
jgi:hypothetical protein